MQKKRANVSLIFAIIAVALALISGIFLYIYYGLPLREIVRLILLYYVPGFIVAFIVPVFVAIGRKAPKAKTPFAIIAFVFLGIQCVLNIVYAFSGGGLLRFGGWSLSNLVNGSHLLSTIGSILRGFGWQFALIQAVAVIAEIFFILKNLLGAIDLCRKERAAAPAQPYYAPQYAQPQYPRQQYAQPQQYAPQAAPQQAPQYAAPAAPVVPAPAPAQEAPKFCPNCGAPVEGPGAFCANCGSPLGK